MERDNRSKKLTVQQAKERIQRYCAYQERCHQEVRQKLFEYGLYSSQVDEILTQLITDGFLNEERFAKAFAGGKFRIKKWGRIKITHELEARNVSKNCIKIGLREIDDADYEDTLKAVLQKKLATIDAENVFVVRDKLSHYAIQKGYESEMVWRFIKEMIPC
ncbi:MAG: regulatory protein RecX [Bacteroidota bacterium]